MTTPATTRWLAIPAVAAATLRLLAACSGELVAGIDSHDAGGPGDASPFLDAGVPGVDAGGRSIAPDAGASVGPDAGTTGNTGCDPSVAWPKMLAAPISPPVEAANLDLWNLGEVTVDYAQSVNCAIVPFGDAAIDYGAYGYWGDHQDVVVTTDPTVTRVTLLLLQGSYTGTMQFQSSQTSPFGAHSYEIGIGTFDRDGVPFVIDPSNPKPGVDEVFEGMRWTFAPYIPPAADCFAAFDCVWGQAGSTGDPTTSYYFTVMPLSITVFLGTQAQGELPQMIQVGARQPADAGVDGG